MKELEITWKHLDVHRKTCDRCTETGDVVHQLVNRFNEERAGKDIHITLKEVKLT